MSPAEQLSNNLLKDTHLNIVKWSLTQPPYNLTNQSDDYISIYLETEYKGKTIGLFEKRYKYYTDIDEYVWAAEDSLCIVESSNRQRISIWEGNGGKTTSDLLNLAKAQASGIHNLLE